MGRFSRVRQRHPSTLVVEPEIIPEVPPPPRKRGRPRGVRNCRPKPVRVKHPNVLNLRKADFPKISPATWNVLVSLTRTLFLGLLRVVGPLQPEAPGATLERTLFQEIPALFHEFIRELAQWWWSNPDRGFLGTTLTCSCCHKADKLKYKGDIARRIVTLFGTISPNRAYYYCEDCKAGVAPLDERLGLDQDAFLPSVREVVTWLTSMDPYGKCLEFVAKLLQFSVSPRSAWLITQRVAARVKRQCDEDLAKAFADPANPRLPEPEVPAPEIGAVSLDGTMGRIGPDENEKTQTSPATQRPEHASGLEDAAEPEAKPGFREIKVGLAGHLIPAKKKPKKKNNKKKEDGRPTLGLRKYAVHLGPPQMLFQMLLLQICRLGLHRAQTLLVIADGAHWIWNGVREHFTSLGVELVEILDYWHAVEHLWELSRARFGQGTQAATAWVAARKDQLLTGKLDEFFAALEETVTQASGASSVIMQRAGKGLTLLQLAQEKLTYFRNNESRIRYHEFLAKGYLIGSGAMEGTCKHLIKERVHRSGMRWLPEGCMSVLRNRALIKSGDWDAFWTEEANRRQGDYLQLKTTLCAA